MPRPARARLGPILAGVAAAASLLAPTVAQADTTAQAEAFTLQPSGAGAVVTDGAASGGQALKIWSNGVASRTLTTTGYGVRLTVRARGQQCSGAPRMTVDIGAGRYLLATVSGTGYLDYSSNLALPAGQHTVRIGFDNDFRSRSCDRNLIVDRVSVIAAPALAPPPPG